MMNNNTQVSLSNGANFSRIRKAKSGIKIPKFQTPAGTIPLWYLDRYPDNQYLDVIDKSGNRLGHWDTTLDHSLAGSTIVGPGNSANHTRTAASDLSLTYAGNAAYTSDHNRVLKDLQSAFAELKRLHPEATVEQLVELYNQEAAKIREYLSKLHTYYADPKERAKAKDNAREHNRRHKMLFKSRAEKEDPNADMSTDVAFLGYDPKLEHIYAGQTFLRRMDQYEKEYDQLQDSEKEARTYGLNLDANLFTVYKKANGDVGLLPNPTTTIIKSEPEQGSSSTSVNDEDETGGSSTTQEPGQGSSSTETTTTTTTTKRYNPVLYLGNQKLAKTSKPDKFRFPTFPLYNGLLHGIGSLTNKKVLDTALKAPVLRLEAPTIYGKVTDAYAERAANEQAFLQYKWGVQQLLDNTNDLGRSQEAYRDVLANEMATQMQNNKAKQDEYNQTSLNLQNIENTNKSYWTQTANQNRLNYVADARDRLNKIAQYQAQQGLLAQENVMANYTDWKAWNRNNLLLDYANWQTTEQLKVSADLLKALDIYNDAKDITKFKAYNEFWDALYPSGKAGVGNPDNTANTFAADYGAYLGEHGKDTPELRLKFFLAHVNDDKYKDELGDFEQKWKKHQEDAGANYAKMIREILQAWDQIRNLNNPINFDGEIDAWLWGRLNQRPSYTPYNFAQYMAKGGRFLEYLKHNRRAEKDIRDTTMKSMSESRKMLRRDLNALDRESLLLLRSIFK